MKLELYKCDRCSKEFKLDAKQQPFKISFIEQNTEISSTNEVCEDCYYTILNACGEYSDLVDKVINEAIIKEK